MTVRSEEVHALAKRFERAPELTFKAGPGGLTIAEIENRYARASISLHGGQVLSFQPDGHRPVLWVSALSHYAPDKAIRGGIPICWPWFGSHPTDAARPAHGFARISAWTVVDAELGADGITRLRLGLDDTPATRELWPHAFQLELAVGVGAVLDVELRIRNPGASAFTCSGALHSYFAISDIGDVSVDGLDGCVYLDKTTGYQRAEQTGAVAVTGETDRVYLDTTADCLIVDRGWQRTIRAAKRGSRTTVVWNPWTERARQLADFGDDEYREMVCVETANTAEDSVTVPPEGEHRLAASISVENA